MATNSYWCKHLCGGGNRRTSVQPGRRLCILPWLDKPGPASSSKQRVPSAALYM